MKLLSLPTLLLTAVALVVAATRAGADELPILTADKAKLTGGITPVGDVDSFRLDLFPGDRATVKVKDAGPRRGLLANLGLEGPDGKPIAVTVNRQGSSRPSFSFDATQQGIHVVALAGSGDFGGGEGNYSFTSTIKRAKAPKTSLSDPGGGTFAIPIRVSDGALLDVKLATKKGGFDIEGLYRPDGRAEAGFLAALSGKERRSVKAKKFAVTGGFGTYELRGAYDAGSNVKVKVKVRAAEARSAALTDAEPAFDPFLDPFPSSGIEGTLVTVVGKHLQVGRGNSETELSEDLADPAGGAFAVRFAGVEESFIDLLVTSQGGGFDLTELVGPEGRAEAAFPSSLEDEPPPGRDPRTYAKTDPVAGFRLSQGPGVYELRGTYDAGATVHVELTVIRGDGADPSRLPRVWLGAQEIDPALIENPFDQVLRFRVPSGLAADTRYDIAVRNSDGQGAVARDAFFFVPAPRVSGLTQTEAGPAGGRSFRILGEDFRQGVVVLFDDVVVQPDFVLSNRIDLVAPPHAPGDVYPKVRDDLGQIAISPVAFTYLDIGSNTITSVVPSSLQGIGGETVTVTGADFGLDTVLTLDGRTVDAQRNSATELQFVAPDLAGGTYELRVQDAYEQSSTANVEVHAFVDGSGSAIPAPLTDEGAIDGWRASRVLVGDVTGDDVDDLVLLRPSTAFGADADRPRVRILAADGSGGFSDATDGIPAVSETDDWRADDGALVDVDGDDDLDLVLITDGALDGGSRSSLRLLLNDGAGTFTDATASAMPAATSWGDRNQGSALVVADVDGQNGPDLVLVHTTSFSEVVNESPPLPDPPPDPLPDPVLVTYYYGGTRVLLNDGDGVFARDDGALPGVDADSLHRFEGAAIAAADVDGQNGIDLVITADGVQEDPDSQGTYLRRAVLLLNDGSGTYTDASDTWLPAPSGAEHLQGDHVLFADHDGDGDDELVILSDTRIVTPGTGSLADMPALRIFENDGDSFAAIGSDVLPDLGADDRLQCNAVAFGDLSGDDKPEIVLVSPQAPTFGERGMRVLVRVGDAFAEGTEGLPSPLLSDDGRGRDVVLADVDGDGDLDIVLVRDESDQTVRNTRVFVNPRLE